MSHPYKDILIAIANGERVEWQASNGEWVEEIPCVSLSEIAAESFAPGRYRIKPKTIVINGIEVQEPVRAAPRIGVEYWLPCPKGTNLSTGLTWNNDRYDAAYLDAGWVHLTKEAAETHCHALLSFTKLEAA